MTWLRRLWRHRIGRPLLGAVLGAAAGGTYYALIGCQLGGG